MKKLALMILMLSVAISVLMTTISAKAAEPGLTLTNTPDKTSVSLGEAIVYTYVITNTTNLTISNLTLTDSKFGVIALSSTNLSANATVTTNATHIVVITDFPGPFVNIATANGIDSNGGNFTAVASASVMLTGNNTVLTKAQILKMRGVPGKGIGHAPGLQKPFNPKSKAIEQIENLKLPNLKAQASEHPGKKK